VIRSSSGRPVARRTLIGALALLLPAIAGCEAGLNAPTLQFHQPQGSAYTVVNGIKIDDVFVLGAPSGSPVPSGASASMFLSIFNGGTSNDTLESVTAPKNAADVKVTGGTVSLPVNSLVTLTGPQPSVVLSNLTEPLNSGTFIPVTLNFQHAGVVTLEVPVQPQSYEYATYSPPASPSPTATPTTVPTPTPTRVSTATPTPTKTSAGTATSKPTP
jgi:copper(I)-binding protein